MGYYNANNWCKVIEGNVRHHDVIIYAYKCDCLGYHGELRTLPIPCTVLDIRHKIEQILSIGIYADCADAYKMIDESLYIMTNNGSKLNPYHFRQVTL